MENLDLATLVQTLIDWIATVGASVDALPGTAAFALGLFTWFMVEQILRRILSWIRWMILVGAIPALGVSIVVIATQFFEVGLPQIEGLNATPEDLLPPDAAQDLNPNP